MLSTSLVSALPMVETHWPDGKIFTARLISSLQNLRKCLDRKAAAICLRWASSQFRR
jgi:hypothetical protein